MNLPLRAAFILALLGALLSAGVYEAHRYGRAADFFSAALAEAHASETVVVDGLSFQVIGGHIWHASPAPLARYRVLRTAYALVLARRAPLLGTPGVAPQSLAAATNELQATMATIASERPPREAAQIARTLYPFEFLSRLTALEEARERFLQSGADADEYAYELALRTALYAAETSAQRFEEGYAEETGTSTFRFPTVGGTLTRTSVTNSLRTLNLRLAEAGDTERKRTDCLEGDIASCDKRDLSLFLPPPETPLGAIPPLLIRSASASEVYVALSQSTCLSQEPGPYLFAYGDPADVSRMPLRYVGNLYFTPTRASADAPTLRYLREKLDVSYSLINPISFYICPDAQQDIGSAYAVLAAARFAQAHPSYAPEARAALLATNVYREPDAVAYLRAAAAQVQAGVPEKERDALDEVLVQWRERSGGFDAFVSTIAQVNRVDFALVGAGVFSSSTSEGRTLFLTHSAFPSLFLAQNPEAGITPLPLRNTTPNDRAVLRENLVSLQELERFVPITKIEHDIDAVLTFDGIRPKRAPTSSAGQSGVLY